MKRKRIFIFVISLLILACGIAYTVITHPPRDLVNQREYVERAFGELIAKIEKHAADPAVDPFNSQSSNDEKEDLWEREEKIYDELAAALPPNLVYWATWSSDGHHGLRGLYRSEASAGYQTYPRPVSRSENGRWALRQGRSFEGHGLLVFEGHVPNGFKRVYTIAFYREEIVRQMSNEATKATQQAVSGNRR